MNHVKAIIIKFLMIAAVLGLVLSAGFDYPFGDTLIISVVLTLVAYVLGDLFIFRQSGYSSSQTKRNIIATISDGILAFLVIWIMSGVLVPNNNDIVLASFISTLVIAVGEWFFHKYLDASVFPEKTNAKHSQSNNPSYS